MARSRSSMPGPWSRATTRMPARAGGPASRTIESSTSPRVAYVVMLRATSEIAVASSVWSVLVSSRSTASSRARWRAVTTSASDSMAIRSSAVSGGTVAWSLLALEQGEALFQVQRRLDVLELHAELDHGEGHLGLDADDHRLRAAQAGHHRDAAQGARDEGVHDVQRGDVDDDAAGAVAGHLAHDVVAQ